MTTIAYKKGVLAADTQVTAHYSRSGHSVKIERVNGWLIGGSGAFGCLRPIARWVEDGADLKKPVHWQDVEDSSGIIISPGGAIHHVDTGAGWVMPISAPFAAIGSGNEFARAALLLGCSAVDAVHVAIHFDVGSGGNVTWLNLDGSADLTLPKEIYKSVNSG